MFQKSFLFKIKLKDTVLIFSSKTVIEKVSNECTFYTIQLITLAKSFDARSLILNFTAQKKQKMLANIKFLF